MKSMITFTAIIVFVHSDFAYKYGECTFVPISQFACPCDSWDSSTYDACSLQECHADMVHGELCEADQILPDGYADFEVDNCGGGNFENSGYDIFVCQRPEKECGQGYIPHPHGLNSYGPWQLQLWSMADPYTLETCQSACDEDPNCWAIEYRRTMASGCYGFPDPSITPWVAGFSGTGAEIWLKNECGAPTTSPTTSAPSSSPTTSAPTTSPIPSFAPTNVPSAGPTFAPSFAPTKKPTFAPSFAPTNVPSSEPTFAPSFVPTNVPSTKPTESPTWPSNYESALGETDNMFDDLLAHFGNSEASFLAACSDAAFGEIKCADVIESLSGKAVVNFVGPNADSLAQQKNWLESEGLRINDDVTLYPPGYFSPSPAPTAEIACPTGEGLVTIDVKVGYWYGATITQLWSLAGYKCEHMSGYPESDFGQYTTHTKKCCLPPASYTLTCSSGPTFGWGDGNIKINGNVYCDSDALDTTNSVEVHQVDLCDGNCADAPESFVQLEETCENGFIPEIAMAIDPSTTSSAAEGISWRLTDACSGGNYSPQTGEHHEYIDTQCCLPKGIYTLTCSTSSVFTWQKSFVLINGRQYCYGSDGAESHVINMCDGVSECPDFTTGEQGSSGGSGVSISIGGSDVSISIESNDGMYNDLCTFANDGSCDESTGFCEVGTDCTDCGNCGQVYDSGVVELKTAFFTAFAIIAFIFV